MKVKELIEKLKDFDQELEVELWDRDYGYEKLGRVLLDTNPDHRVVTFEAEGI